MKIHGELEIRVAPAPEERQDDKELVLEKKQAVEDAEEIAHESAQTLRKSEFRDAPAPDELVHDGEKAVEMAYAEKIPRESAQALMELAARFDNTRDKKSAEALDNEALTYLAKAEKGAEEVHEQWEKETREITEGMIKTIKAITYAREGVEKREGYEVVQLDPMFPAISQRRRPRAYRVLSDTLGMQETRWTFTEYNKQGASVNVRTYTTRFPRVLVEERITAGVGKLEIFAKVVNPHKWKQIEDKIKEAEEAYQATLSVEESQAAQIN